MGATFSLPEKDRYGYGRGYLDATMRVLCAGRIAEARKTGEVSSGAAMDIQMATNYARHMVLEWGMSDRLGFVRYSGTDTQEVFLPDKDYSPDTARIIDEEVKAIIDEAFTAAEAMIDTHWDTVCAIAEALLRYETLQHDEVMTLIEGGRLEPSDGCGSAGSRTVGSRRRPQARTTKTTTSPDSDQEPGGDFVPSPT